MFEIQFLLDCLAAVNERTLNSVWMIEIQFRFAAWQRSMSEP
jgi:hypothetical protein